jgi:hypothetical protein
LGQVELPRRSREKLAADYAAPHSGYLTQAVSDMQLRTPTLARALTPMPRGKISEAAPLAVKRFTPASTRFLLAGVTIASDITFEGGPDDVFIIQIETPTFQTANTHVCVSSGLRTG